MLLRKYFIRRIERTKIVYYSVLFDSLESNKTYDFQRIRSIL